MSQALHRLEKRAELLSQTMTRLKDRLRDDLAMPGERRPFTTQMSKRQALDWWRANWETPAGKEAMDSMRPVDVLELHAELTQYIAAMGGGTALAGDLDDEPVDPALEV